MTAATGSGERADRRWSAVRTPAFWILCSVTAVAVLVAGAILVFIALLTPRSASIVAAAVAGYTALVLFVVLRWADHVEARPVWLVTLALAWGGSVAVAVGGGSGYFLDSLVARAVSPSFAAQWGPALVAPTAEEAAKAGGVVLLLLATRPFLSTVWSGAVYGAVIGLGFAAVEDVAYGLMAADEALPDDMAAAFRISVLRFLVPGFAGHPAFTAVAGAGIAYAWLRTDVTRGRRVAVLATALAGSWVMHFAVNSPLAPAAAVWLTERAGFGVLTGFFLVVAVPAVPALCWLAMVRRGDARVVLGRAAAVLPGAMEPADIAVLASLRRRTSAVRAVRRSGGRGAAGAARRLQRAQLGLAAAVSRPYRGYAGVVPPGWLSPPVQRWWAETYAARQGLVGPDREVAAPAPVVPARTARWGSLGPATLIAGALAGAAYWPVGVIAAIAASALAVRLWRQGGRTGRLVVAAVLTGLFVAYAWATSSVITLLYPT